MDGSLLCGFKRITQLRRLPRSKQIIFFQENSIWNVVIQRIYLVFNLTWYYIAESQKTSKRTKNLRELKDNFSSMNALMTANGPSFLKLNFQSLMESQNSGEIKVFGINYSPLFDHGIRPDYVVLSDHYMHPRNYVETNIRFWKQINSCPETILITPTNWCNGKYFSQCSTGKCLHFNDIGAEGLVRGINPLRPRGYLSVTALKALAISDFMGFKEIGVIGLDNTFYKGLKVTQDLEMVENAYHASNGQHFNSQLGDFWKLGVSDYFFFVSLNFYFLKKYFSKKRYVNLDRSSLVDAFTKIKIDSHFAKLVRNDTDA